MSTLSVPPMFVAKSSRGFFVLAMMFRAAMWKIERVRLDELGDELLVRDRALDELGRRRDGLGLAGEQVVEDRHLRAGVHEPLDDRAAHEPGPAGHEDPASAEERSGLIIA